MVGITPIDDPSEPPLRVLFGLVFSITPRSTKTKNKLPAARISRQCNPKSVEVAFLTLVAAEFFAENDIIIRIYLLKKYVYHN